MNILETINQKNETIYYIIEKASLKLTNEIVSRYEYLGIVLLSKNHKLMKVKEMQILDRDGNKIIALIDNEEILLIKTGICKFQLRSDFDEL